MKLLGYCKGCHRTKRVRVSATVLADYEAEEHRVLVGVCDECAQKQRP